VLGWTLVILVVNLVVVAASADTIGNFFRVLSYTSGEFLESAPFFTAFVASDPGLLAEFMAEPAAVLAEPIPDTPHVGLVIDSRFSQAYVLTVDHLAHDDDPWFARSVAPPALIAGEEVERYPTHEAFGFFRPTVGIVVQRTATLSPGGSPDVTSAVVSLEQILEAIGEDDLERFKAISRDIEADESREMIRDAIADPRGFFYGQDVSQGTLQEFVFWVFDFDRAAFGENLNVIFADSGLITTVEGLVVIGSYEEADPDNPQEFLVNRSVLLGRVNGV